MSDFRGGDSGNGGWIRKCITLKSRYSGFTNRRLPELVTQKGQINRKSIAPNSPRDTLKDSGRPGAKLFGLISF